MSDAVPTACAVPARLTLNGRVLDRRWFLCALSLTASGAMLAGRAWLASPDANGAASLSLADGDAAGMWHVDDMWGHMPRYAHPISCTPIHEPMNWDDVAPVDRAFVS
jgi:hypothetical protein